MKFLAIILSLLFLFLSVKPCSDGLNSEDLLQSEISSNHNHQEDNDDSCSITCFCNCCGISFTYEQMTVFELVNYQKISTQSISTYQSIYWFDFPTNIWQPPQRIS